MSTHALRFRYDRTPFFDLLWPVDPSRPRSGLPRGLIGGMLVLAGSGLAHAAPDAPPAAVVISAGAIEGQPDGVTQARGGVRLGQGALRLDTPQLLYDARSRTVTVVGGGVRWGRDRDRVEGESGEMDIDRTVGVFRSPRFYFGTVQAGGVGSAIHFLDADRVEIRDARLTSCLLSDLGGPLRPPGAPLGSARGPAAQAPLSGDPTVALNQLGTAKPLDAPPAIQDPPGWELRSPRILLDFDRREGVAENAQVRFLGVPLLVLPRLSFPLGDERRSGWLAPTGRIDSRNGIETSIPYYINLAPNRDATIIPSYATRRGPAVELEYRVLGQTHQGQIQVHHMPRDLQLDRSRSGLYWQHQLQLGELALRTHGLRVSDDDYWKDFGYTQTFRRRSVSLADSDEIGMSDRVQPTLQPRLLGQTVQAERPWQWGRTEGVAYARIQHWQVLQGMDPNGAFVSPYQRSPQVGVSAMQHWGAWEVQLETEVNRFTRPPMSLDIAPQRSEGNRWHALGSISRPWVTAAGWFIPKFTLNSATYRLDDRHPAQPSGPAVSGPDSLSRSIPTLSVDSGLNFERPWRVGARDLTQTLEPRLVYVNTPMRDQRALPNFDAAPKEFNSTSIFSENAFSGIDRVSDAHQMTLGLTSRAIDARSGAEMVKGSIAQRLQFRDQLTTPAGAVASQRVSDVLLAASVAVDPRWGVDSVVQYSPDLSRTTRSVMTLRLHPGPHRTVLLAYRYARESAESVELRSNWPLWEPRMDTGNRGAAGQDRCAVLVTGAARLNYNTRESRLADSLAGLELDSGCWIMRLGVQRQSTGVTETVTRLIFQLELSGLTRSRTSPIRF